MDEQHTNRYTNPRRRKRSEFEIFKEAYLPVIIAGVALLLILVFIIGSIVRGVQRKKYEEQLAENAAAIAVEEAAMLEKEANDLLRSAALLAEQYDYTAAISVLESFSGDCNAHEGLRTTIEKYTAAKDSMVLWNDPSQVLNLSFQLLIADPARAFSHHTYANSFNRNFVTTEEFIKILQQLYENGFILIRMSDITDGTTPKDLYLPNGKKPLILTQTNVNYNTYIVDGDGDKLPDKNGGGFASKLVIDENGNLSCEYITAEGEVVTGPYDLVPILDSFVETHPDFSYRGAKATLALTGYDGLFGYRTTPKAQEYFGTAYYNEQVAGASQVAQALRAAGYEFACYTYSNDEYGTLSASEIMDELTYWENEVTPIIGQVDTLVFAQNSDISTTTAAYTGEKFAVLKSFSFTHFIGFCTEGTPWFTAGSDHIRQGRVLVTGSNLEHNAAWFEGILDPSSVLDKTRGTVPG